MVIVHLFFFLFFKVLSNVSTPCESSSPEKGTRAIGDTKADLGIKIYVWREF